MASYYATGGFYPALPVALVTEADRELFELFELEVEEEGGAVSLFAPEWSGVASGEDGAEVSAGVLFSALQELVRRSGGALPFVCFEAAESSSRRECDGFGGIGVFIAADRIETIDTHGWLEERMAREAGEEDT